MQKVYLLLRNNQQTGPFNLEELIQFDLKPFDLIWIEGKSAGWYYPQELKALHPYLPFVKTEPVVTNVTISQKEIEERPAPKKVFVSMPATAPLKTEQTSISEPVNDLHERYKPGYSNAEPKQTTKLKSTYNKTPEEAETNYTDGMYQQGRRKKRSISKKGLIAACLIVTVAFAGWWAMKKIYDPSNKNTEQQTTQALKNNTSPDSLEQAPLSQTVRTVSKKQALKKGKKGEVTKPVLVAKPLINPAASNKAVVKNTSAENEYEAGQINKQETKTAEEKKSEPVTEAPKEKKKLRDKILDLFKKKASETKTEEAKPAEEENGQRSSTRRESDASLAQLVSVSFMIPNDWMMGIKGAKATLNNRSNQAIAKAIAEVLYYNDDNELLDKKTISFSNIGAKKSGTVSIPDHSSATKLEYKIISVGGAGEPFAKL